MQQVKSKRTREQERLHDDLRRVGGAHSKAGAGLLADHINAFWKGRAKAERYELDAGGWGVRSNLVNGLPPVKRQEVRRVVDLGGGKCRVEKTIEQRRADFLA
jgi:hypothetical protein